MKKLIPIRNLGPEVRTGRFFKTGSGWKPTYEQYFRVGFPGGPSSNDVFHGIAVEDWVKFEYFGFKDSTKETLNLYNHADLAVSLNSTVLSAVNGSATNYSAWDAYIKLEYTKTTDEYFSNPEAEYNKAEKA